MAGDICAHVSYECMGSTCTCTCVCVLSTILITLKMWAFKPSYLITGRIYCIWGENALFYYADMTHKLNTLNETMMDDTRDLAREMQYNLIDKSRYII